MHLFACQKNCQNQFRTILIYRIPTNFPNLGYISWTIYEYGLYSCLHQINKVWQYLVGVGHCYAWQVWVPYFIHFIYICILYTHHDIFLFFINFILDIPYMNINRSTTPAGQLWFVCLILLYVTYNKYFHIFLHTT